MKCPKCGSEVRPSKKYPGYYLCDTCRKRYPETSVITDSPNVSSPSGSSISSVRSKSRRKKTKKRIFSAILLILLVFLIVGVIIAYVLKFFEKKEEKTKENTNKTTQANQSDESEAAFAVGETAEINNIKITALGYEESPGDEWATPEEGNQFVFVNLEITNNSEEEITVSSMASFESYCGEYKLDYSSNAFTALATNTDKQQMDSAIAPGESLNGYLCLEVPLVWETIEIQYSDDVWSEEKVVLEIVK